MNHLTMERSESTTGLVDYMSVYVDVHFKRHFDRLHESNSERMTLASKVNICTLGVGLQ